MSTTSTVRHTVVGTLAVAGLLAGAALPADGAADLVGTDRSAQRTRVTLEVPDCHGCVLQLFQGRETDDVEHPTAWISREKRVRHGKAAWRIRSRHTQGMSITVRAPWEGRTGYVTTVAMRYGGQQVGDHVSFREARDAHRSAACWEGTRRARVTMPVVVRRVRVQGQLHRVPGSIAYLPTTQAWLPPMLPAPHGVLGLQDVVTCV